jgi:Flp pilus assembly protein TadG
MTMRATRANRSAQRGVAAAEFIITLPLLLLVLVATVELGRGLFQYNALTKALRDGARYAASYAANGNTGVVAITPQLRTETQRVVVYGNRVGSGNAVLPGLAPGNVTVSNAGGGQVQVSAAYAFTPLLGGQLPTFGIMAPINVTFTMNAAVVMRAL